MTTVPQKEIEQGFAGQEADTTPNESYSVAGVTSGAPVPEANPARSYTPTAQVGLPDPTSRPVA